MNTTKATGVKAPAVDINTMNASERAALLAQIQQSFKVPAEKELEVNQAYKKVLDLIAPLKAEYKGFKGYWQVPQGLAYKIAEFLQSKATKKEPLGSATETEIVEAMTAQHLDQTEVIDTLQKRTGTAKANKDENKRNLWQYDIKTSAYTLLTPFKTEQKN